MHLCEFILPFHCRVSTPVFKNLQSIHNSATERDSVGWSEVWSIFIYSAIWPNVLHSSYFRNYSKETKQGKYLSNGVSGGKKRFDRSYSSSKQIMRRCLCNSESDSPAENIVLSWSQNQLSPRLMQIRCRKYQKGLLQWPLLWEVRMQDKCEMKWKSNFCIGCQP